MRSFWSVFALAVLGLLMWGSLLIPTPPGFPRIPLYAIAAAGVVMTLILLGLLWALWPKPTADPKKSWMPGATVAVAVAGALLVGGTLFGTVRPVVAALVLICAGATLLGAPLSFWPQEHAGGKIWARPVTAAVAIAGSLLIAGVFLESVRPLPAALVLICGAGALAVSTLAADYVARGNAIEVSSHWGGLGGSQGGWRVSPSLTLVLLALILLGTTVAVATIDSGTNGGLPPPATSEQGTAPDSSRPTAAERGIKSSAGAPASAAAGGGRAAAENAVGAPG